jgi:uncharacterized protein
MTELLYFLTGVVVGTMNAIAGGGMLIGFPALVALGLPPMTASTTGNIITIPGQLASAYGYRKYVRRIPKRLLILVPPLIAGAVAGALVLRNTTPHDFERLVPWLVLFGVTLFAVQPYLHFHVHQHVKNKRRSILSLIAIGLVMLPLGFYGGYFGAGIGFMMLAFLGFTSLADLHTMNAIKNLGTTFISTTTLCCLATAHLMDWHAGLIAAVGCGIGGYTAARYSQRVSSHWLRILVICIGLGAVVFIAIQNY